MSALERLRWKRSQAAVRLVVTLAAAATVACGGASGSVLDGTAAESANAVAVSNGGALLELHNGLPTGRESAWYPQRLSALDFEIVKLRQERDGVNSFRVRKAGQEFDVRIVLDGDGAAASTVEIVPVVRAADEDIAAPPGSREQPAQPEAGLRREPAAPPAPGPDPAATPAPSAYEPAAPPAPPLPEPRSYTVRVPTGALITARLDGELSSASAQVGDGFAMRVAEAIWIDGVEVLPAGTTVWGYVAEVERAGRPNKGGRLVLATESVQVGGEALALDAVVSADGERLEGRDSAHEDVKEVAIGAGLGGLVGGLLGGKKGVLVGVLAGGGGTFVATKGEEVQIPLDAPLSLELQRDLNVTFVDSE